MAFLKTSPSTSHPQLVDAAVFEPIPYRSAILDGCTHVLVLCTRPAPTHGVLRQAFSLAMDTAIKKLLLSPSYMRLAWREARLRESKAGITHDQVLLHALRQAAKEMPLL